MKSHTQKALHGTPIWQRSTLHCILSRMHVISLLSVKGQQIGFASEEDSPSTSPSVFSSQIPLTRDVTHALVLWGVKKWERIESPLWFYNHNKLLIILNWMCLFLKENISKRQRNLKMSPLYSCQGEQSLTQFIPSKGSLSYFIPAVIVHSAANIANNTIEIIWWISIYFYGGRWG